MSFVNKLVYLLPGVILALTFHEYAHGMVARFRGDDTAYRAGRLTLNPIAHLDPIGTLLLLFAGFGWAKPVPVNAMNLANPKKDMVWVALAGPVANMILALLIAIAIRIIFVFQISIGSFLIVLIYAFQINLVLAAFNLIPIPPLDGSKIVSGLLPLDKQLKFDQAMEKGPLILMIILVIGSFTNIHIFSMIISPWISLWSKLMLGSVRLAN